MRSPTVPQQQKEAREEEQLVTAWEGPMEQAAASLLGAREKVSPVTCSGIGRDRTWMRHGIFPSTDRSINRVALRPIKAAFPG
jgi:hypothetical protein